MRKMKMLRAGIRCRPMKLGMKTRVLRLSDSPDLLSRAHQQSIFRFLVDALNQTTSHTAQPFPQFDNWTK